MGGRGSGGHNRKSAARKKLEGYAGKRKPRRRQQKLSYSGPLGSPPANMRPRHKEIWAELSSLIPANVVEKSDRWMFEVLVCLMSKFRGGTARSGEVSQLLNLLAKVGMTPADRDRIHPATPAAKNDQWAEFAPPSTTQ
jgi:hypothetical protein